MKRILVAGFLTLLAAPALADSETVQQGNFMLKHCRAEAASQQKMLYLQGHCIGRVTGIMDTRFALAPQFKFCPPDSMTYGQALAVFVKWADAHPEKWHVNTSLLILGAFHTLYPCP